MRSTLTSARCAHWRPLAPCPAPRSQRVLDHLFGGTSTPLLGAGTIPLVDEKGRSRLPAPPSTSAVAAAETAPPPEQKTLIVWENERKDTRLGWSAKGLLPTDPSHFYSGEGPPYTPLPSLQSFALPSQ